MTSKIVSFEPAHFHRSYGLILPDKQVIIDKTRYIIEEFDSHAAARYKYHHEITRLSGVNSLSHSESEWRLADSILEYFFNSGKEYFLDEQKNTHRLNMLRRLFTAGEIERYIVLPIEDQIEDVLGLGYRSIQRKVFPSIIGKASKEIEKICEPYKERTDWKFKIAAGFIPSQIENIITTESCGEVTLKLSSRGFRFSID